MSRYVRQLEEAIGLVIFERSTGGAFATPGGRDFLRTARSILEQTNASINTAHSAGRGETGQLAVGFYTSLSSGNLRASLMDFEMQFPGVELRMVEGFRNYLFTELRNGALDIAIVTEGASRDDCKSARVWSEPILLAMPNGHPLTAKDTVYWTDLRNETVLLSQYDGGRELEDLLMAKLVSAADRPKIKRHNVSRGIIKSMVSMGSRVSLVTESDVGAQFAGLIYRDIRDGTGSSQIGFFACWREDNSNPALANFLKLLNDRYPLSGTG